MPKGIPPTNGVGMVDGVWLNAFSGGHNFAFQNGIAAAGNSQATATQLADLIAVLQIDTSTASTAIGAAMPAAIAGVNIFVINNTANAVTIYPQIANNPLTGAQDTFNNNATTFSLTANSGVGFTCGKSGRWFTN